MVYRDRPRVAFLHCTCHVRSAAQWLTNLCCAALFTGLRSLKRPVCLQIIIVDLDNDKKSTCRCALLPRTLAAVLSPLLDCSWLNMMRACTCVLCTVWACTEAPDSGCVPCVDVPHRNVASVTVLGRT